MKETTKQNALKEIDKHRIKFILAKLPALTPGQCKTLAAHPEIRDKLAKVFNDEELFHEYLKKTEGNDG